jgi:PAS domain S-box-containing protein
MNPKMPTLSPMPPSAAQTRPAARSGSARQSQDRALIDAALAVNEAPTLDEAFSVLVKTGRELLGADRVSVAVWEHGLERGVIRAVAGVGAAEVSTEIRPGRSNVYRTAASGAPVVVRFATDGLEPRVAPLLAETACFVGVPFTGEGVPPVTFHAAWTRDLSDAALGTGVETLEALGALTRLAYRTERERLGMREKARLEAVLNSVADGIVVRTESGIVLNTTARRFLELDAETALPSVAPLPEPEADRSLAPAEFLALLGGAVDEERHFRYRVMRPSGREAVLDGTVSPILESSGGRGSVTVFRDVTVEHNREFLTEQLLERLFETLPLAIVVADPQTHEMLSVNEALLGLVGFAEDEVIGCRPPYPWLASPEEVERITALPPNEPVEALFRHQDGRLIPVGIRRFGIPGPNGAPVAVVALISDLSEQRRFEQQLVQSGKLATIGELAAGVAHEINNPLFAILGLVEFLLKEAEPGTKAHDRLVLVQQTGLEIKEIVRALLDFAREPSEERALVSVHDAARETVELIRRTSAAKAVEIVETYDEQPTPVVGNPNQLKQIFLNLVTNASQALSGEGLIEVAVRRDGDWVVASVSDEGPGIPEAALTKIFEPFFTTKRDSGGSGLGLSVSHGIAEAHGGSLTAENRLEGGARFTLRLPIRETM